MVDIGEGRDASQRLLSTEPIPTAHGIEYQSDGGTSIPADDVVEMAWQRKYARYQGRDVEVWGDRGDMAWVVFRDRAIPGLAVRGRIEVARTDVSGVLRGAWLPAGEIDVVGSVRRTWSDPVPQYLPQGAYGELDDVVWSIGPNVDAGANAHLDGSTVTVQSRSLYPASTLALTYNGPVGWADVPSEAVSPRSTAVSRATLANHSVTLASPFAAASGRSQLKVLGAGKPPRTFIMSDGYAVSPVQWSTGTWLADVRIFDLEDLEVAVTQY